VNAGSALGGTFLPDVVDEDLAHSPRCERQEVLSIDEAQARAPSQFQICLVNQSGRGQGFAGPAARELSRRRSWYVIRKSSFAALESPCRQAARSSSMSQVTDHQFRMFRACGRWGRAASSSNGTANVQQVTPHG
jgi:hypothetical protein